MARALFVACLAVLALLAGNAGAARPLVTAVHEPNLRSWWGEHPLLFDRIQRTGSGAIRVWLDWKGVAPSAPADPADPADPGYSWSHIDLEVAAARARGLRVLLTLREAPSWAERRMTGRQGSRDPDPVQFGLFARAAALRYHGQVFDWEIWNEPNLGYFLSPQFDAAGRSVAPALYRGLVNAAAQGLHAVDARNRVVAGATAPFGHAGRDHSPMSFMRKALCLSRRNRATCAARTQLDVWSHHPYTNGGPTAGAYWGDNVSIGNLPKMLRALRAAQRVGHVITQRRAALWVTEFSWDTKGPDVRGVPHRLHARWTSEALYQMWRSGVTLVTWWLLRDRPFPANLGQSGFFFCGSATTGDDQACWTAPVVGDSAKRSLRAFRFPFVALLRPRGVFVWGRTPTGLRGRVLVERRTPRGWRRVARLRTNRHGIFLTHLSGATRRGQLRARLPGVEASLPFALKPSRNRDLGGLVFGCGGPVPC